MNPELLQRSSSELVTKFCPPPPWHSSSTVLGGDVGSRVTFPVASCCRIANIISLRAWQAPETRLLDHRPPLNAGLFNRVHVSYPTMPTTFSTRSSNRSFNIIDSTQPIPVFLLNNISLESPSKIIVPFSNCVRINIDFSNSVPPRRFHATVYTHNCTGHEHFYSRWMILVPWKMPYERLPREPNKRHLQNRARFNRAEDLRLERKSRYPQRCIRFPFFSFVCSLSLSPHDGSSARIL